MMLKDRMRSARAHSDEVRWRMRKLLATSGDIGKQHLRIAYRELKEFERAVREDCAKVAFNEACCHNSGNTTWDRNVAENIASPIRGKREGGK